jgi:hypothetical protein
MAGEKVPSYQVLQLSSVTLYQARRTFLECLGMHLGVTPIQASRHCRTATTECRPRQWLTVIEISFERMSRVNAIIIDHHHYCISAASRHLLLNSLKSSVITEKAKTMCRIHDARPAIAKRRNTK